LATQLLRVALIGLGASVYWFAALLVVSTGAFTAVSFWLFLQRREQRTALAVEAARVWRLLKDSWPVGVAGLAILVYVKIDQVMLGQMTSNEETGLYSAAVTLSELWYFIPVAIANTAYPVVVDSPGTTLEERRRRMQRVYDAMAAIGVLIAGATTLCAEPVVRALYGQQYSRASHMLVVHVWSLPFVALGTARARFLVAEQLTVFAMLAAFLGAATNVLLNVWLIPPLGGLGAAWATLASYALAGYASSGLSREAWPHFVMQSKALLFFLRPRALGGLRAGP
jgi:polysaccharide transporter, PST family